MGVSTNKIVKREADGWCTASLKVLLEAWRSHWQQSAISTYVHVPIVCTESCLLPAICCSLSAASPQREPIPSLVDGSLTPADWKSLSGNNSGDVIGAQTWSWSEPRRIFFTARISRRFLRHRLNRSISRWASAWLWHGRCWTSGWRK